MSDLLDMLRDVPPLLAAAWGGWLSVGLGLLLWHLRARGWEQEHALVQAEARRSKARPGGWPPSEIRRPAKTAPVDAFAELEALLDAPPSAGAVSRRPGD
jgi:hypothetical protein